MTTDRNLIIWLKCITIFQFILLALAMVCIVSKPTPIEVVEIVPDYTTFNVQYATIYADEHGKFLLSELTSEENGENGY